MPPHSAVEIIAHRGASHDAPENTLAAFNLGWQQHADACELDIRLTKDGRIVAIHDSTTRRAAGVNRRVSAMTLEELRTLDAGSWKGAHWKGERVPTLGEVIATVPDGKRLFIEIKCGPEVLPELERILSTSGKSTRPPVLIGFDFETMRQARERFPQLPACWVSSPGKWNWGKRSPPDELIAKAVAANLTGLALDRRFGINGHFVSRAKDAGLKLYVWTVDDAKLARKLAALGIDGITTNRPLWLRTELAD
ncbi:MAG: glycerophosphodiester phosphodiesterase [Chthoniobacteraceae bacterium]